MKQIILLFLIFFFISCKDELHSNLKNGSISNFEYESTSSNHPIEWLARRDYSHTSRLILGSDTQSVDSLFNFYYDLEIINYPTLSKNGTFFDSVALGWYLRKYYISKDLEKTFNIYMAKNCNQTIHCDSSGFEYYFYEFTHSDKRGNPIRCCFKSMENAYIYFNDLRKVIQKSKVVDSQVNLILNDFRSLINSKNFPLSDQQKKILINHEENLEEKDKMKRLIDTLEMIEQVDREALKFK